MSVKPTKEPEPFTDLFILCGKKILSVKVFKIYEEVDDLDRQFISFTTSDGTYDFYTKCLNHDCGCAFVEINLAHDNVRDGDVRND